MGADETLLAQLNWHARPQDVTLSRHLAERIRELLIDGHLRGGDRLPSARVLAGALEVARGTVETAWDMLRAEGLIESRVGDGTRISHTAELLRQPVAPSDAYVGPALSHRAPPPAMDLPPAANILDLRPCRPATTLFPRSDWRRCLTLAANAPPSPDYGCGRGDLSLREQLCHYLRRRRGLRYTPQQIIITNGAVHAMHLASRVLLGPGTTVAVENPGYPLARQVFSTTGATIEEVPVDDEGLQVHTLANGPIPTVVYVTPSHQFPTGERLSLRRRHALVTWCREHGALIVEDDYDGEFRYDVPPLSPLAAWPDAPVLYCGTFSKTMFPGLRIGFAAGHEALIEAMADWRAISEYSPPTPTTAALAEFIANGAFERHVERMRQHYAKLGRALADTLAQTAPACSVTGLDAGLHAIIEPPQPHAAADVSAALHGQGVLLPTLCHYDGARASTRDGLVAGFSALSTAQITSLVTSLTKALADCQRQQRHRPRAN
ncbi:MAG: PLP-dependent aminotransferase family protein [Pseudomonadota bacterium]